MRCSTRSSWPPHRQTAELFSLQVSTMLCPYKFICEQRIPSLKKAFVHRHEALILGHNNSFYPTCCCCSSTSLSHAKALLHSIFCNNVRRLEQSQTDQVKLVWNPFRTQISPVLHRASLPHASHSPHATLLAPSQLLPYTIRPRLPFTRIFTNALRSPAAKSPPCLPRRWTRP